MSVIPALQVFMKESMRQVLQDTLHKEVIRKIILLQSWLRMVLERRRFLRMRQAALTLQVTGCSCQWLFSCPLFLSFLNLPFLPRKKTAVWAYSCFLVSLGLLAFILCPKSNRERKFCHPHPGSLAEIQSVEILPAAAEQNLLPSGSGQGKPSAQEVSCAWGCQSPLAHRHRPLWRGTLQGEGTSVPTSGTQRGSGMTLGVKSTAVSGEWL